METLFTKTISLDKLHRIAMDNGISFASYRLPYAKDIVSLLQWKQCPLHLGKISEIENLSGFVFAPFDKNSGFPIRFIQPDLIAKGTTFSEPEKPYQVSNQNNHHHVQNLIDAPNYFTSEIEFKKQVEECKSLIKQGKAEKIVLSRVIRQDKPQGFNPTAFFQALVTSYPHAFVFTLFIPDTGFWFGASPEPLFTLKDHIASTVSLAGTRKYDPRSGNKPWRAKEKEEQQIVTTYIESLLDKFNVQSYEKTPAETFRAGEIEHLKTGFHFPVKQLDGKITDFIEALNPTPSVCGLPKENTRQIIHSLEKHRREYYSGFLGTVNLDQQWNLFVNLRSMKALKKHFEFYTGAGITSGSVPDSEWHETINKMTTLQNILNSL